MKCLQRQEIAEVGDRLYEYYANVVTINAVTVNAMLFDVRLCSSEKFIHIGPKCIKFRSQIDPRFFQHPKKSLRKALLL